MQMNIKALAFAFALTWAGAIFVTGLVNLIWPGYGGAFLETVASVYPGYHGTGSLNAVDRGNPLRSPGWFHWRPGRGLALQSVCLQGYGDV